MRCFCREGRGNVLRFIYGLDAGHPSEEAWHTDTSKKNNPLIVIAAATVSAAVFSVPSSFDTIGLLAFFSSGLAAAIFAFGYFVTASPYMFLSAPLAYLISVIVSGSPLSALAALTFLPPAFLLTRMAEKKPTRCQAIVGMSASAVLWFLVYSLLSILVRYGSVSVESLEGYFNELTATVRGVLSNASLYDQTGNIVYLYTAEQVDLLIRYMLLFFPSMLLCISNLYAAFISAVYFRLLRRFSLDDRLTKPDDRKWELEISVVSAAVFSIAYLLRVLFSSNDINAVMVVTTNLLILLVPGFAWIGTKAAIRRIRQRSGSRVGVFYIAAAIILCMINVIACMTLLAFFGVVETFLSSYRIRRDDGDGDE